MHPASLWLYTHWSKEYLPNNMWVAASSEGIIMRNENLDIVINEVSNQNLNNIVFAFITFDTWQ
jgi:hypothetical protein